MLALRYPLYWRAAGIVLLTTVLALALLPPGWLWPDAPGSTLPHLDKWLHGITFALLALWYAGQYARRSYWRIVVCLAAFGLLIELVQRMTDYRTADWMDLAADLAGSAVGIAIALAGPGGWSLRLEDRLLAHRG